MKTEWKEAILEGYLSGDGGTLYNGVQTTLAIGSASKKLALSFGTLAQTLGYNVGFGISEIKTTEIMGVALKNKAQPCYRARITINGRGEFNNGFVNYKVSKLHPVEKQTFYGIVTEDETYWADGVFHHNTHPIHLEQDEASDYPEAGWVEINETPKLQNPAGRWRAHGVTRGVGDTFDNIINGRDSTWTVHRIPATYRPNWTEAEREEKMEVYGGADSVDFRRNVLGLPGDGNSPLFVLHRLLAATDTDESSSFNRDEYYYKLIDEAMVREVDDIEDILDIPAIHKKYTNFWIGMDVGWTESPSVITIFAETKLPKVEGVVLKLVTRLILRRMDAENQVKVMTKIMEIYHPLAFAMDATGAGAPLLTWLEKDVRENPANKFMLDRIKGFGFSEKVIVKFDPAVQINVNDPDGYLEAAIKRPFIEASTDAMRMYVDTRRMQLPYDKELIGELQATTIQNTKAHRDAYGRTVRKKGMHSLDAMRMATLAFDTHDIDEFIAKHKNIYQRPAPILVF